MVESKGRRPLAGLCIVRVFLQHGVNRQGHYRGGRSQQLACKVK